VDLASALSARLLAVGPATARAVEQAGLHHEPVMERFDADALLERILETEAVAGRRFLLPGAVRGREVLADGLRAAGASVDEVPVYRTVAAECDRSSLRRRLAQGEFHALTFGSPSAVRAFVRILDRPSREACGAVAMVAIGPHTADQMREEDLPVDSVAERANAASMVDAVVRALRERAGPSPGEDR
jgi:uroporphyrinogen III methyltransferase/synthase